MKKRRRKIWIAIVAIVFPIVATWMTLEYNYYTREVTYASTYGDTLAIIPIYSKEGICNAFIRISDDQSITVSIDTGTNGDYFILSPKDFQIMEDNHLLDGHWGLKSPSFAYTALSRYGFNPPRKYYMGSLPLYNQKVTLDYDQNKNVLSISHYGRDIYMNELRGIPFVKGQIQESLMGIHVLLDKIVEFSKKDGVLRLHKSVPSDYTRFVNLQHDKQGLDFKFDRKKILTYSRHAMPVEVNGHQYMFYIDTGHGTNVSIRLPKSESKYSSGRLYEYSNKAYSLNDSSIVHYQMDETGNVTIGGKKYKHAVHYTDDARTEYTINPFDFFDEDFILDFKNKKIWFKE